jgi:ankyrin repeat protein
METLVSELRQALYRRDRDAADALLAAGAPVNVFDAAALGDIGRLRALLEVDPALVHEWSADGFTALHFAAYLGGADAVRLLLEAGSDPGAVARNDMRVQPLHSAAALGDVTACELLLRAGADPNAAQQGGFVPLDEALITKNEALAELLRSHGARVSGNPLPD